MSGPYITTFDDWMRMVERKIRDATRAGNIRVANTLTQQIVAVQDQVDQIDTGGDSRTPAAPIELVVSTALYVDKWDKATKGTLYFNFPDVTLATDATALAISHYELWGRDITGITPTVDTPPWKLVATSGASDFTVNGFDPSSQWEFAARAIGVTTATPGLFSAVQTVTFSADTTPPPAPSSPTAIVNRTVFNIQWDGLFAGGVEAPLDFAYVEVAEATVANPTTLIPDRLTTAGSIARGPVPYGETRYYRFRTVDTSGNPSTWSGQVSATSAPLVTADISTLEDQLAAQAQDILDAQAAADAAQTTADTAVTDAATAQSTANSAASAAAAAQTTADAAEIAAAAAQSDATAAQSTADAAATAAAAAQSDATAAQTTADAAALAASTAQSAADAAQVDADQAALDAAAAAGIADSKADVLIQSTTPAVEFQKATTLWIDTTGGANTPKRWNGTLWEIVTDQAAIDAANAAAAAASDAATAQSTADAAALAASTAQTAADAAQADADAAALAASTAQSAADAAQADADAAALAAAAAQTAANNAQADADQALLDALAAQNAADLAAAAAADAQNAATAAQNTADAALTSANSKNRITYSTLAPSSYTGIKVDDTWWVRSASGTVIEQWRWDGAAWVEEQVDSQLIANLDVGKLVASAATIDTLVAQKIASESGEFLEARAEWFAANQIEADWIGAGAVGTNQLAVGSVWQENLAIGIDELNPNPNFSNDARYNVAPLEISSLGTSLLTTRTTQPLASGSARAVEFTPFSYPYDYGTSSGPLVPLTDKVPAKWHDKFYLEAVMARMDLTGNKVIAIRGEFYNRTGAYIGHVDVASEAYETNPRYDDGDTQTPDTFRVGGVVEAPEETAFFRASLATVSGSSGSMVVTQASVRRAMTSTSPSGERVEISPRGIRMWDADDAAGDPSVDITAAGLNSITLKDSSSGTQVVLSKDGSITADNVDAGALSVGGTTLPEHLATKPEGLVVRGYENTHSGDSWSGSTWLGTLCVRFLARAGRRYRFNYTLPSVVNYTGTRLKAGIAVSTATPPSTPTAMLSDGTNGSWIHQQNSVTPGDGAGVERLGGQAYYSWASDTNVEAMVAMWCTSGGATIWTSEYDSSLEVEEVGYSLENTGFLPGGTPSQQYVKEWTATSFKSYYNNGGTQYSGSGPAGTNPIQGYTSYWPSGGLQSSLIFFNDADMRTQLSGATINKVEITLNMEHFHSSSGGTARVHMHDFTGAPSSYNYSTSGNFTLMSDVAYTARGQTKTFTVSNTYGDRLKAGTGHGIALDPRGSTSTVYYGYSSWSTKPKIKITYTK